VLGRRWIVVLPLLACGCSGTTTVPGRGDLAADGVSIPDDSGGGRDGYEEHDFGPVLTHGENLLHEFILINSSEHTVRFLKATASTPCCSTIGPLPTGPIPPGGQARIATELKSAGNRSEDKRVWFTVQTDSHDKPIVTYVLRARFCPEWQVVPCGDQPSTLAVNQASQHVIRVVTRRVGGKGETLPERVEAESPLVARFIGQPHEVREPNNITSDFRDVEVTLAAASVPMTCRRAVVFHWPEGRKRSYDIAWRVASPLPVGSAGKRNSAVGQKN
jgi:hypothetical protein